MGNLYTGRTESDLFAACEAEYRFYRNSLRNFRPGTIENLGEVVGGDDWPGFDQNDNSPRQGHIHGLPSVVIDDPTAHFNFPDGLDAVIAAEAAFSFEYLGFPQDHEIPDATGMAFFGENATDESVALLNSRQIYINFGVAQTSDTIVWWRPDSPLHCVVTRASGATGRSSAWCNAVPVLFNDAQIVNAGQNGMADAAGEIFNFDDGEGNQHPLFGHHLLLRFYTAQLTDAEVAYLFRRAQKLVPQTLFRLPIHGED